MVREENLRLRSLNDSFEGKFDFLGFGLSEMIRKLNL